MLLRKLALAFAAPALSVSLLTLSAQAQETAVVAAPQPAPSEAAPIRLIPVAGASSFAISPTLQLDKFDQGFSAGIFADLGRKMWTFETGVLSLSSSESSEGPGTTSIHVNTWGIPLLLKVNFSGQPHSTVFVKVGGMPFNATGDVSQFNIMAVGGLGGDIPIGRSASIILDASYNRLFSNTGDLTNYQGITLLAGLNLSI